jgi:hypothetical protein
MESGKTPMVERAAMAAFACPRERSFCLTERPGRRIAGTTEVLQKTGGIAVGSKTATSAVVALAEPYTLIKGGSFLISVERRKIGLNLCAGLRSAVRTSLGRAIRLPVVSAVPKSWWWLTRPCQWSRRLGFVRGPASSLVITRPGLDAFSLGYTGWQRLVMPQAPFERILPR